MAYATKKKNSKCMAEGGDVRAGKDAEDNSLGVHKRSYSQSQSGGTSDVGNMIRNDPGFKKNGPLGLREQNIKREHHKSVLREATGTPRPTSGLSGFAEGGEVKSDDEKVSERTERGLRHYGGADAYRQKGVHEPSVSGPAAHIARGTSKEAHKKVLGEMKSMPGPTSGMSGFAEGGEVDEIGEYDPVESPMPESNEAANMEDADMIARIMHKRKMYSKGGQVSNDVGVAEADKLPAEYDDLVLRDDDLSGADYDGEDSGDMDGSTVSDDPVDRIMMKKKKERMPRPA